MNEFDLNPPENFPDPENSRMIIVANGASATMKPLGREIDTFDCVVRINNYVTTGMEDRVGSRTDIWVNGANQGLKKRPVPPNQIVVMIPSGILEEKGVGIHDRIWRRLRTTQYHLVPLREIRSLEALAGLPRPTTGLFSILYFYTLGYDLTLHGFDFFQGSPAHYFDSGLKRWLKEKGIVKKGRKHALDAERDFVEALISEGRLRYLLPR